MTAAKTYMLHITYRDPCFRDAVRITTYTAGDICAEIRNTGAYAEHWDSRHATLDGPFPFPPTYNDWPSRAFVYGSISTMAIGHRKYLFQVKEGDASYSVTVQRIA
jgi:hypothetical protein